MNQIQLPSLKNLQLLPNPNIQESSYLYPDTSEATPLWKQTLMSWCKETSYEQYLQINAFLNMGVPLPKHSYVTKTSPYSPAQDPHYTYHSHRYQQHMTNQNEQISSNCEQNVQQPQNLQQPQSFQQPAQRPNVSLNVLANAAVSVLDVNLPVSVTSSKDQFYGLSESSGSQYDLHDFNKSSKNTMINRYGYHPVNVVNTKEPSNGIDQSSDSSVSSTPCRSTTPPDSPQQNLLVFTPVISERMIDSMKITKSSKQKHKKTNSFKARQMKKILTNREVLNQDSLPVNIVKYDDNRDLLEYRKNNIQRLQQMEREALDATPKMTPGLKMTHSPTCNSHSHHHKAHPRHTPFGSQAQHQEQQFTPLNPNFLQMPQLLPSPQDVMTPPTSPQHTPASLVVEQKGPSPVEQSPKDLIVGPPPTAPSQPQQVPTFNTPKSASNLTAQSPKKHGSGGKSRRSSNEDSAKTPRTCISCGSIDSPCWRPSWSYNKHEQLCNSCGLRFKKTSTRCLNRECKKIPSKGELSIMKSNGYIQQYVTDPTTHESVLQHGLECLFCGGVTETVQKPSL
ncbi:hypothetical protein ACO0RG_002066 [Hanseniaspora osmophila]